MEWSVKFRLGTAWRSGSGWVRHGLVWRGRVRQGGLASYGLARKAWHCEFWYGQSRRSRFGGVRSVKFRYVSARQGGSGMLGSGKLDYGMAVGVWSGMVGHGRAV